MKRPRLKRPNMDDETRALLNNELKCAFEKRILPPKWNTEPYESYHRMMKEKRERPTIEIYLEDLKFCPKCGKEITKDNFKSSIDEITDDQYCWVACNCGWSAEG